MREEEKEFWERFGDTEELEPTPTAAASLALRVLDFEFCAESCKSAFP